MKNLNWTLILGIIPVCITCGPLSMTEANFSHRMVSFGGYLLVGGLMGMYLIICRQQKLIDELSNKRCEPPLSPSGKELS